MKGFFLRCKHGERAWRDIDQTRLGAVQRTRIVRWLKATIESNLFLPFSPVPCNFGFLNPAHLKQTPVHTLHTPSQTWTNTINTSLSAEAPAETVIRGSKLHNSFRLFFLNKNRFTRRRTFVASGRSLAFRRDTARPSDCPGSYQAANRRGDLSSLWAWDPCRLLVSLR